MECLTKFLVMLVSTTSVMEPNMPMSISKDIHSALIGSKNLHGIRINDTAPLLYKPL